MKVLLTGATGFLGKYVIEELKNNSYQVVAFGRNEKVGKTLIDKNVEFYKGDLNNIDDLFKDYKGDYREDFAEFEFFGEAQGREFKW